MHRLREAATVAQGCLRVLITHTHSFQKCTLQLIDGYIFCIRMNDNEELDIEDTEEIFNLRKQWFGNKKYVVIVVSGNHSSISAEGRKRAAEPEYALNRVAFAMVVNSLAQRLIGNFYIRFDKPPAPARLFNDETKAIQWLKTFEAEVKE